MKLSKSQQDCIDVIRREKFIRVTFWGGSVHSMSVRSNIRTLEALVKKGIVSKTRTNEYNTFEYKLV